VGATLGFLIPPTWYQTLWFQFLRGFAVLLAVYALYLIRLRQLSARLRMRLDERLEERTRIARDLHDTLLQTIQGSKLIADVAGDNVVDPAKTKHALKTLSEWLGRAALEGRTALESLRATAVTDLGTALRSTIENYKAASEIQFGLSVQNVGTEINPVMKEEVYWIAYEAIRNATNHSQASRIEVELAIEEDLKLRVKDDGCGIADSILLEGKLGHFGLNGMRERAAHIGATLTISSSSQLGTTVALFVPGKNLFSPFRKVEPRRPSSLKQGLIWLCRTRRRRADRDSFRH
jgi:signal transduction histidine kinase